MRRILSIIALNIMLQGSTQEIQKLEVLNVVNQVFEAMRTNDSTLLKDAFIKTPSTYTVFKDQEGMTQLRVGDFKKFKSAVGALKTDVWNEPIWNEKVEIDGSLAQVWVDYAFYVNNVFSHCGVDAFHLVKQDGKWKIFHLVDTRRRINCDVPEMVEEVYGK